MNLLKPIILLSVVTVLSSACVSRTSTIEKGYGEDLTEKKIVWIWQDEFRNSK